MTPSLGHLRHALEDQLKHSLRPLADALLPHHQPLPLSTWALGRDEAGALQLRGVALAPLLERHGSPVHVVDAQRLEENARDFFGVPRPDLAPVEVFSSYKTNPVPGVLARLHALGVGAEVVSPYELWLAFRLGVPADRIIYNGPAKSPQSLEQALRAGVGLINVNSRRELATVAQLARRLGVKARVGVRVAVPGAQSGQFGERIDDGAALRTFEEARRTDGLHVVALHAHLNGEIASVAGLDLLLDGVLHFADELEAKLGLRLEILDLGGNLACATVSHRRALEAKLASALGREEDGPLLGGRLSISDYVAHVGRRVHAHFTLRGAPVPRVFLEPGRAMTMNAQHLLTQVVHVRDPDAEGRGWAVLDAGVNVAEPLRSEHHELVPLQKAPGARTRTYRLSGPSCSLGDQLAAAVELPELEVGDALAVLDTGAYFVAYSTCFSFPRPGIVLLDHGREEVLRRGETFEDLVALDQGPGTGRRP